MVDIKMLHWRICQDC